MTDLRLFRSLLGMLGALLGALFASACLSSNVSPGPGPTVPDGGDPGAAAVVSVSTPSQDFGSITLGATSIATAIVVTNTGTGATGALSTALAGADASAFQLTSNACAGNLLGAGASCTLNVIFVPTATGTSTALLSVGATPGGTIQVTLTGTAPPPGVLSISPSPQDFGAIVVGAMSPSTTFTVSNTGAGSTGALAAALGGSDSGHYAVVSDACTGKTLAAGATCTLALDFAPSSVGAKEATLSVTGMPGGTANASLTGTAIAAGALSIAPSTQDFGSVTVGSKSAAQTFTVSNTGGSATGSLAPALSGANGAEFAVVAASSTCGAPLAAGASCTVAVTHAPTSAGAKTATLTVSGSPGGSGAASLTATGVAQAAITLTPVTQDFGSEIVAQTSTDVTFAVKNTGGVATGALTFSVSGTNEADFPAQTAKTTCSGTIAAGASCEIALAFKPGAAGARAATLQASATPGGKVTASLTGTGLTAGALAISPTTFTFASTLLNQSTATRTFTVSNTGQATTGTLTAALSGTGKTQFVIDTDGCTGKTLTGTGTTGATCAVTAHFAPTSSGAQSASLVVSQTGTGGSASASLGGTGEAPAALAWSASTYDTGTAAQNTATTTTLTLDNTGDVASAAPTFSTGTGGSSGDFTVAAGACAGGIAAHQSCSVSITFTPKTAQAESATLTATASPGGTAATTLDGTGVAPAKLTLAPTPFAFGSTPLHVAAASETFTITNVGGVAANDVAVTVIPGTGGTGDFTPSANTCPTTLNAGGTCNITVTFTPSTAAQETASLSVSGTPGGTTTSALSGTGLTAASLAVSPGSEPFGQSVVGVASSEATFTFANNGEAPTAALSVSSLASGAAFTLDSDTCQGVSLKGTSSGTGPASCAVTAHFTPPSAAPFSDSFTVSAGSTTPVTVGLSGTGITAAALTLTSAAESGGVVPFGAYIQEVASPAVTFTVTNSGEQTSGPVSIAFGGSNAGDFAVTGQTCPAAGLAQGASCAVSIVFTPTATATAAQAANESATASASASPGGASAPLSLSGIGYPANSSYLVISPTSSSYGNVTNGGFTDYLAYESFTVTNLGGAATGAMAETVTAGAFSTAYNSDFNEDLCAGQTIARAGGSCLITVRLATTAAATSLTGTLTSTDPSTGIGAVAQLSGATVASPLLAVKDVSSANTTCTGNVGTGSETFQVTNTGGAAVTLLAPSLDQAPGDHFTFITPTGACSSSLGAGASCTLQVNFQGACVESFANLRVQDTGGDETSLGFLEWP